MRQIGLQYSRRLIGRGDIESPPTNSFEGAHPWHARSRHEDSGPKVDRRKFLTGVAVAGAAGAVAPQAANATAAAGAAAARLPSALPPTAQTRSPPRPATRRSRRNRIGGVAGSDFMVDVIKTLDIKYLPANCASSFRGIHESLINYGGNKKPEFLTCMHEESAVGMAHGYFKVAGKPLLTLCHGTVGLQHAAMAIYNAWCDRVPVIVMGGNDLDAAHRPPGVPTIHSAQDINALVRDFTKWDDTPVSLQHFAQSFVRAYKIAMTPPYGPVMLVARRRPAAGADQHAQRREALHPEVHADLAAAGRDRRREGSGAAARQRRAAR